MSYEEIIINEYVEQYKIFMESEKQLIEMFESENINENWIQNYHIYDPAWINSWKEIISFDELIKESIEDTNKIIEIIKKSLNSGNWFNAKLDNKSKKYLINPMKPFDLISDEVWKLFTKNTSNKNCEGKISLLKGNKKIIIRLDEYCYSIRFLSKKNSPNKTYINEYNEFIIAFNSNSKKKQNKIIKEIAKSNIDDWMKSIGFKFNVKQFPIKKDDIPFIIKQKYNNWNFTYIKKYGKTSNISAVMRALSTIEPLTDYFMNNKNDTKIFDNQSTLLKLFKQYFVKLWSNEEEKFMPKEFCESISNLNEIDSFNIKKEQDPIKFLRLIIDHLNEKLNQKDDNLKFNFNNIYQKLNKLSKKPEYLNDLDKIINESNSIIGKLFYGLMLEVYLCKNCKKNINENVKKFDIIDIDYKKVVEKVNNDESQSFYNCNDIDFFITEDLDRDNKDNIAHPSKECNTCKKRAIFKKEILSYPPFLLIRLNRGELEEKKGFVNNANIQDNKIKYDKSIFMNNILSDIIKNQNKNNKSIEYELISMVNYMKIKDNNKNEEKIEFINLSKSPFLNEDEIWNSFICNRKPVELRNSSYDNDISLACILFYKLK